MKIEVWITLNAETWAELQQQARWFFFHLNESRPITYQNLKICFYRTYSELCSPIHITYLFTSELHLFQRLRRCRCIMFHANVFFWRPYILLYIYIYIYTLGLFPDLQMGKKQPIFPTWGKFDVTWTIITLSSATNIYHVALYSYCYATWGSFNFRPIKKHNLYNISL